MTAAVVGLIAVTSTQLLWASLPAEPARLALAGVLFALSLVVLYRWKSKLATVVVVLGAALLRVRCSARVGCDVADTGQT